MTRKELLQLAEIHEGAAEALLTGGLRTPDWYAEAAARITCAKFLRELAEKLPK